MGKQYNKTEKRRRRLNYLKRVKEKTRATAVVGPKAKARRPSRKKAAEAAG